MKRLGLSLIALTVAASPLGLAQAATIYFGAYPNSLMLVDEGKGAVVQHIPLATGLPTNMRLSNDKKWIYVTTNDRSGIEVVDTATRKVVNSFALDTPTMRYRFNGGAPDPTGKFYYTVLERFDKKLDHWDISKPMYAVIDLDKKAVVKTVEVAAEDENGNRSFRAPLQVSPDGKYIYQFRDKIIILDSSTFKVVDRIDLSTPDEGGIGSVNLGGSLDNITPAGQFVSLFNASDPYIHNKVFGIARVDLSSRQIEFTPIAPSPATMAGLQVTPDGKTAYTITSTGGNLGNKRCELWRFNMNTKTVEQKAEFSCRTRFYFGISSNGQKLYVYGAGYEVEVFDAKTLKYETRWDLNNDTTMAGYVVMP